MLKQCRQEREAIITYLSDFSAGTSTGRSMFSPGMSSPGGMSDTGGSAGAEPPGGTSSMIDAERKRILILKKRQKKEIQSTIEGETRKAQMAEANRLKLEAEAEKQAIREKELAKKKQAAVEKKRAFELQKKAEEEELEEQHKVEAQKEFARGQAAQVVAAQAAKERKAEARRNAEERARKQAEYQESIMRMLEQQEAAAALKMEELLEEERVRTSKMEEAKQFKIDESRRKRAIAEVRIAEALKGQQYIEHQRREVYNAKQHVILQKKIDNRREVERAAEMRLKKLRDKENKRLAAIETAKAHEEDRINGILQGAWDREATAENNRRSRLTSDMIAAKRSELKKKDKVDNIERMRRIDEFVRLQTLQKLQMDDVRTKSIKHSKSMLLLERKKMGIEMMKRKDYIAKAMVKIAETKNLSQIDKILDGPQKKGKKKRMEKSRSDSDVHK